MWSPSLGRVLLLLIALPACGSPPSARSVPNRVAAAAPPPATPETRFRGYVNVEIVPFTGPTIVASNAIESVGRSRTKDLVACLRHQAPQPIDVWIVGRVNEQGHVEVVASAKNVPETVASCVNPIVQKLEFPAASSFALSMFLHAEPAPSDCAGDDCMLLSHDDEEVAAQTSTPDKSGGGLPGLLSESKRIGVGSLFTFGHGGGPGAGIGRGASGGTKSGNGRRVEVGKISVEGHLPPEVVERIIGMHIAEIRLCYEKDLLSDPTLEGTLRARFVIGGAGEVTSAMTSGDLPSDSLGGCASRVLLTLKFPSPERGIVNVTVPIHFEHGDTPPPPPPPVYTVSGLHFPALTTEAAEAKLSNAGWRTMAVQGTDSGANFVVFGIRSGASMDSMDLHNRFIANARFGRADGQSPWSHKDSEGFRLAFEGAHADALEHDLIDPQPEH